MAKNVLPTIESLLGPIGPYTRVVLDVTKWYGVYRVKVETPYCNRNAQPIWKEVFRSRDLAEVKEWVSQQPWTTLMTDPDMVGQASPQ